MWTVIGRSLGALETNAWAAAPFKSRRCWLIDAPPEPESFLEDVAARGWEPEGLLLTHAHWDHIAGLEAYRRRWPGLSVWVHPAEASWLQDPLKNLSYFMEIDGRVEPATHTFEETRVGTGALTLQVLPTPGHSPGGVSFYQAEEGLLFSGDALFYRSIGRTDFPGSDPETLRRSLFEVLLPLPGTTRVFPGHGRETSLGSEARHNEWLLGGL